MSDNDPDAEEELRAANQQLRATEQQLRAANQQLRSAQEVLAEKEAELRNILENSTILFYSHTTDHRLTYVSPQCREYLQCESEEAMVRWTEFVTDNPINDEGYHKTKKAIETGERQPPFQLELEGKEGKRIWVEVNEAPVVEDGKTVAIVGSLTDITAKRRSLEEIRKSREFLENVLESIQDGISVLDIDLNVIRTNGRMKEWYSENLPLEGKRCFEIYQNRSEPCDPCPTIRCLKSGRTESDIVKGPSGSETEWIELFSYPVRDTETGEITGAIEFVRDITRRMNAQRQLESEKERAEKNEQMLMGLIERSPLPMAITDEKQDIELFNQKFTEQFGYTLDDVSTAEQWWNTAYPDPDYRETVRRNWIADIRKAMENGTNIPVQEWELTTRKGEKRICQFHMVPLGQRNLIVVQDITDRRIAEEALIESEEKYRTLFETMEQGVVYQDSDGSITSANPAAERILGLTWDQMIGRTSVDPRWKAVDGNMEELPGNRHPAMIALRTGKKVDGFLQGIYNPRRGGYVWIMVNSTPQFREGQDRPYQVYSTFLDITDLVKTEHKLKTANQQLRAANQQLRTNEQKLKAANQQLFAAERATRKAKEEVEFYMDLLGHDLGNIHQGISGSLQLLKSSYQPGPSEGKVLDLAADSIDNAMALTREVVLLSRLRQREKRPQRINIDEMLDEVLKRIGSTFPDKDIRVEKDLSEEFILAEPIIRELFFNLLHNSVRLQDERPWIGIRSERTDSRVRLLISDRGPGVPEKMKKNLFQRFGSEGKKTRIGLGLSIVKVLAERYGGEVRAEDRVKGDHTRGALFVVDLPAIPG